MKKTGIVLLQWLLATTLIPALSTKAEVGFGEKLSRPVTTPAAALLAKPDLGRLPLYFAKNVGQSDSPARTVSISTPTVSAVATDGNASDLGGNTGTIVLTRSGSTNAPLFVKYKLTGSAKNGVDYSRLRRGITIPAGQFTVSIIISPLRNSGSVVKATLTPLRRTGYSVSGSSATVTIRHYNKVGF